ncbi:hypothetical protein [Microbacterium sp. 3J1]|uniref:hypothetical protein n=1 Tax=Microbacterium sp. 3J1 TaxID=861269 RepID=UPI000A5A094B|nr:hypothetical protein [Microbacterium sp. 3J1]
MRLQIHSTFTGAHRCRLTPSAGPWTRRLTGGSNAQHTFLLNAAGWPLSPSQNRDVFEDTRNTVVVADDTGAAYAGIIQRSDYARSNGALKVRSVDIRSIMKDRLLHGVNAYPLGNLTIVNRSNEGAVRAILQRAMQWGPLWEFPLDLPPDGPGDFSADWRNYQGMTIEDCLNAVEERGVEIDFHPTLNAQNVLRWQVRVAPKITSGAFDLPVTSPKSPISKLSIARDASRRLTGAIVFGNGMDEDMVTAWAGVPGFTIPVRDASRSAKDERDAAQLQQIANAYVAESADPIEEWSFTVDTTKVPLPNLLPGRVLNLDVRGDKWIPDGSYRKRVIALSGDALGHVVTPEVQDA